MKKNAEKAYAEARHLIEPDAIRMIREQEERIKSIIDPPTLRMIREQEQRMKDIIDSPALKIFREQQELARAFAEPAFALRELSDAIDTPGVRAFIEQQSLLDPLMPEMVEPLMLARNAIAHSMFSNDFVEGVGKIAADYGSTSMMLEEAMQRIAEQFKPTMFDAEMRQVADFCRSIDLSHFYESFRGIEEITRAAQSVMATVNLESLGDLIGLPDSMALQLQTYRLNNHYANYTAAIAALPGAVIDNPFMVKVPAFAVYAQSRFTRSITTHEGDEPVVEIWTSVQVETTDIIETTLPLISPALLKSWKGGLATVRRRDDDWVRQASASLRYVLITTLDMIAPKDKVLADGVHKDHLSSKGEAEPASAGELAVPLVQERYL